MIIRPETLKLVPKVRPLVLITGFLGAGKTSFLRAVLNAIQPKALRADVILNDYENAHLDAETLRSTAASIEAIAASCACCEGLDFLIDLATSASTSSNELLLVEVNGTADPVPLLESFTLLESKLRRNPRWQVCVIDARRFGRRDPYGSLEEAQLETASHFYLSHAADTAPSDREALLAWIRAINPAASETTPESIAAALAETTSRDMRPSFFLRPPDPIDKFSKKHTHTEGRFEAHQFTGCQILLPARVSRNAAVRAWLTALPPGVVRAKALVSTYDEPGIRRLFERVGTELMPNPQEVEISNRVPSSAILIGPSIDPIELLEITCHAFGPDCRIPSHHHRG